MPTTVVETEALASGMDILTLLTLTELVKTRSEGRRLIQQGGSPAVGKKSPILSR